MLQLIDPKQQIIAALAIEPRPEAIGPKYKLRRDRQSVRFPLNPRRVQRNRLVEILK